MQRRMSFSLGRGRRTIVSCRTYLGDDSHTKPCLVMACLSLDPCVGGHTHFWTRSFLCHGHLQWTERRWTYLGFCSKGISASVFGFSSLPLVVLSSHGLVLLSHGCCMAVPFHPNPPSRWTQEWDGIWILDSIGTAPSNSFPC